MNVAGRLVCSPDQRARPVQIVELEVSLGPNANSLVGGGVCVGASCVCGGVFGQPEQSPDLGLVVFPICRGEPEGLGRVGGVQDATSAVPHSCLGAR